LGVTTTNSQRALEQAPDAPVLLVVDADREAREATEAALVRRFGADYRVLTADSPDAGLATLARLAEAGDRVALVAADLHVPGMGGIEFLEQAYRLHREATRVLLVAMDRYGTRIPFTHLDVLQRATALGRIDFWLVKGMGHSGGMAVPAGAGGAHGVDDGTRPAPPRLPDRRRAVGSAQP